MKNMKFTPLELCLTAVFTALVFAMTFIPKIPIPLGYAHLGNAAVFLAVVYLGRHKGALAGAIGSALADLIGGFAIWIVPTLIIKYVMAMIFAGFYRQNSVNALALTLAGLWMVASYTLSGAFLYGSLTAGLASAPGLFMEGVLNAIVFVLAAKAIGHRLPH